MTSLMVFLGIWFGCSSSLAGESIEQANKARDMAYRAYSKLASKEGVDSEAAAKFKSTVLRSAEQRVFRAIQNQGFDARKKLLAPVFDKNHKAPKKKKGDISIPSSAPLAPAVPKTGAEVIEFKGKRK